MNKKLAFVLLFSVFMSCKEKRSDTENSRDVNHPNQMALGWNNKATELISQALPHSDSLNNVLYDSALIYLDRAIQIDSSFSTAYTNKAQVLLRKGLLEQSLTVLDEVQAVKKNFAEAMMAQGFILEKMGREEPASEKYKKALQAYMIRLEPNPDNIKVQSDIAFLYLFLEGKDKSLDEIQNLIIEHPSDDPLKAMERIIKSFDRKKFIEKY